MKYRHLLFGLALIAGTVGCTGTHEKSDEEPVAINDFPTQERIDYALSCIAKKGGLTYISQYGCGCKVDKIAEKMSFEEFDQARTFGFLRSTPGEAGGVFRDPEHAKKLKAKLQAAEEYAEKSCFVKQIQNPKLSPAPAK
ncbi:MAG: hypothetical protein Q7U98_15130 [Methylicorpusculum sp.]|uniref:hypothetical protein n=1 Tax=Methylicorpusculum sp. TaxID=2713644 RepID=UPI00271D277C|nr:hypothetical protein [Methylicorpusculum sp.]MDO8843514.1 hypothetical protein [Methylicorpusculum sp.]MDO8940486.1 hypothetical protein [Methylicorpusculum sp.]MDO9240603.1 hypothetical protein [Methylicorpusculum sp.]MDP2178063.1 hypothetical protein [Methylicorpusculum sp.]MDP2201078.1 hypothetical protein [Methylicorpusculum sp.]